MAQRPAVTEPELPYSEVGDLVGRHRDIMNLMEFPFFSIQKKPLFEPREYDDGNVRFEIQPGHAGLATIWDKDVLIYVASIINQKLNAGEAVEQRVRFHAYDFFTSCGRSPGGRAYQDLVGALNRLQSTSIRTNIKLKSGWAERGFHSWIKSGRMREHQKADGRKVLGMVEVELDDWIWKQIVEDRTLLAIDPNYFKLTSGIARRVYEVGRKHVGAKRTWEISLAKLAERVGYEPEDKKGHANFKTLLCDMVAENDLPEFTVQFAMLGDAKSEVVDAEAVRARRTGLRGFKVVYRRRNALEKRGAQEVLPPLPTAQTDFDPRVEEPVEYVTAEQLGQLVRSLGNSKRTDDAKARLS